MSLLPPQRRRRILQDITQSGAEMVSDLSERYGVSEMTIRRDLIILEEEGAVQRTHGGAVRQGRAVSAPVVAREQREQLEAEGKAAIARHAARTLVSDGDIVILEGGTTVAAMVPHLRDRQELTVVTNGLSTASDLQRLLAPSCTVICAGGVLRRESHTFVGPLVERFFREFHANKLFLSATGLTLQAGVTDPNMLETQVKRAMIASATQTFLLLDSSKFGVKSLMTVLTLEELGVLITDEGAPEEMVRALGERGVPLQLVPRLSGRDAA